MMCRVLRVSRASFYRWRTPSGPSARELRHQRLGQAIRHEFDKAGGKAGRDQLMRMLNANGIPVSAPTVGAIMREEGLRAVRTRAWK